MKELFEYIKNEFARTKQPVSTASIMSNLGYNHKRRVTEAIRQARLNGYNIISTTSGYTVEEGKTQCTNMINRLDSMIETVVSLTGRQGFEHIKSKLFQIQKEKLLTKPIHPQQISIFDQEVL